MAPRYWPLEKGHIITSPFGQRSGGWHAGADFGWAGGSANKAVYAVQGGVVLYTGAAQGYGGPAPAGWIVIDHDTADGSGVSEYGHIVSEVRVGQRVEAGQRIGYINPNTATNGSTPGNIIAPHLHFSVMPYEYNPAKKFDPIPWLSGATYPGKKPETPTPTPTPTPPKEYVMKEINQIGVSPNHSARWGSNVRYFVLHTQEGGGTARSLAGFLQNPNSGVSYHYSIDNSECVDVVDTDRASWSALNANPYTINLCFAGSRAAQSRQEWLDRFGNAIDYAALLFVQDARKYDPLPDAVLAQDYNAIRAGRNGAIDHSGVTYGLGIGDHTDVGRNFPWDVFSAAVKRHSGGAIVPPVPVPNAIEEQYKVTPWLGKKLTTDLEFSTPDGRGKYAPYENGYIYWTAETGARPIPMALFEPYSGLGWEGGVLGYPIAFHTVLEEGDVQAFEKGVLYRKYGQPGYYVTGAIGEVWMRSGFEKGPFGWPTSNEIKNEDGSIYQLFENGKRIYWSPTGVIALQSEDGPDTTVTLPH